MNQDVINEYYNIIKNKISQSSFESALRSIDKLLFNFPTEAGGYYYKGVCNFAMEKYEEAIKCYTMALKFDPGRAKAYFNLGICYYTLNKYDSALVNIGKALIIFSKQKELDYKQRCIDALKLVERESKGS